MQIEIPKFEVFIESNISGIFVVNPYWLEHLLNLFYQGYVGEVSDEMSDTIFNHIHTIENSGYGVIGKEFHKKHLKGIPKIKKVIKRKTKKKTSWTIWR